MLRDGAAGLEVLMLHRDRDLSFAGGMWVFPGGRIDPADHPDPTDHPDPSGRPDGTPDLEAAARRAAVREAAEEAGLSIDPGQLRRWSHWTPPPESPKRFSTAFYVAPLPPDAAEVVIDDGEIRDHRWLTPAEVLELRGTFGFMAIHGGNLERATDVVALEAAERAGASCYAVIQAPPLRHHVPSACFTYAMRSCRRDGRPCQNSQ